MLLCSQADNSEQTDLQKDTGGKLLFQTFNGYSVFAMYVPFECLVLCTHYVRNYVHSLASDGELGCHAYKFCYMLLKICRTVRKKILLSGNFL